MFKSFGKGREHTFSPMLNWLSNAIPRRPWVFIIIPLFISFTAIYKIKDLYDNLELLEKVSINATNLVREKLNLNEFHKTVKKIINLS